MEKNAILRKPTATINISNPFSFGEQKLLNLLMYNAQTIDGLSDEENSVLLEDVYIALGWKSDKNEKDIKDYLRTLVSTPIEWNEQQIDKSIEWTVSTFLSKGKISKRSLYYRINPEIVAQVKRPTLYAKMVLLAQTQLRKKHSLVLYEYFQSELGRLSDNTILIENTSIAFLLHLLGQQGEHYQQYKHLNQDILKPSLNEINKFTDIDVYLERVVKGKKTIGVNFSIKRKASFQLSLDLKGGIHHKEKAQHNELVELLQHYGVTANTAHSLVGKYSIERIKGNIQHLKNELTKGTNINNKGAWLRKSIENDYQPKKPAIDVEIEEQRKAKGKEKFNQLQEENRLKKLKLEYADFKFEILQKRFLEQPKAFQEKVHADFLKEMTEENNFIALKNYKRESIESPFVKSVFFDKSLQDQLLTEYHEQSVEAFDTWQQSQEIKAS